MYRSGGAAVAVLYCSAACVGTVVAAVLYRSGPCCSMPSAAADVVVVPGLFPFAKPWAWSVCQPGAMAGSSARSLSWSCSTSSVLDGRSCAALAILGLDLFSVVGDLDLSSFL